MFGHFNDGTPDSSNLGYLRMKNRQLKMKNAKLEANINKQRNKAEETQAKYDDLRVKYEEFSQHTTPEFQEKLEQVRAKTMKSVMDKMGRKVSQKDGEIIELTNQLRRAQVRNHELTEMIKNAETINKSFSLDTKSKISTLGNRASDQQHKIADLTRAAAELQRHLQSETMKAKNQEIEIENLSAQVRKAKEQSEKLQSTIVDLSKERDSYSNELNKEKSRKDTKMERVLGLRRENKLLKEKIEEFEKEVEKYTTEHTEDLRTIEKLSITLEVQKEKNSAMQTEHEELKAKLEDIEAHDGSAIKLYDSTQKRMKEEYNVHIYEREEWEKREKSLLETQEKLKAQCQALTQRIEVSEENFKLDSDFINRMVSEKKKETKLKIDGLNEETEHLSRQNQAILKNVPSKEDGSFIPAEKPQPAQPAPKTAPKTAQKVTPAPKVVPKATAAAPKPVKTWFFKLFEKPEEKKTYTKMSMDRILENKMNPEKRASHKRIEGWKGMASPLVDPKDFYSSSEMSTEETVIIDESEIENAELKAIREEVERIRQMYDVTGSEKKETTNEEEAPKPALKMRTRVLKKKPRKNSLWGGW